MLSCAKNAINLLIQSAREGKRGFSSQCERAEGRGGQSSCAVGGGKTSVEFVDTARRHTAESCCECVREIDSISREPRRRPPARLLGQPASKSACLPTSPLEVATFHCRASFMYQVSVSPATGCDQLARERAGRIVRQWRWSGRRTSRQQVGRPSVEEGEVGRGIESASVHLRASSEREGRRPRVASSPRLPFGTAGGGSGPASCN